MTRSGAVHRSGDPRRRAAQLSPADRGPGLRTVLVAVVLAVAVIAALLVTQVRRDEPVDDAARHGQAACELTAKAEEAASVDTDARYAAAALLMDQAIVESGRATRAASDFTELDRAMRAVHAAAHRGEREPWRRALDTARKDCQERFG